MRLIRKPGLTAVAVAFLLAGCTPSPGSSQEGEGDAGAPALSDETLSALEGEEDIGNEEVVSYSVPAEELITATSVGVARPGTTLGILQGAIGGAPIRFEQSYMVDVSAVCVDDGAGAELFCAAFPATAQPTPETVIAMVVTRHPRFRTREGVGPGVAVEDAALVFGDAFFVYSDDNEGREYVEFDRGPAGSVRFRPVSPSLPDGYAGLYEETDDTFHETLDYRPDTVIGAVEVHAVAARE